MCHSGARRRHEDRAAEPASARQLARSPAPPEAVSTVDRGRRRRRSRGRPRAPSVGRRRRPGPGGTRSRARPSPSACLSTQTTTRSPGLARDIAWRTASISSRTTSSCLQRPPSAIAARTPSATSAAVSPRLRLRSDSSSRTTTTSKCCAATAPSSRMSSSRRSPAVAITPMREGRPSSLVRLRLSPSRSTKSPSIRMPGRVVAVVDDDLHAVDVDLVEPPGGEVVVRREGPQPLPDVVQRGACGERGGGGGERVRDVHPRPAAERRGQQVGPRQLHLATAVLDHDHLAALAGLEHQRLAAAAAVLVDHVAHLGARLGHREPHDLARAAAAHLAHQRVVGVEHGVAVARHRLDEHRLHVGELLDGVDAAQPEVVGLHVEHDGDVVALVAEALAQDAAAGDLEDGEVDARVLQHHPCRLRARTRRRGSPGARR